MDARGSRIFFFPKILGATVENLVVKGGGLAHVINKDRLSTRFFAAIFRVVVSYALVMCPGTVW